MKAWGFLVTASLVILFQNCSQVKFADDAAKTLASTSSSDGTPVVCDPFSAATTCDSTSGSGLLSNVYYLPNEKNSVQNYIDYGQKLNIYVQMSNLNIPTRDWTSGFPGASGLLKDQNGEPLIEYFGLDLKGYISFTNNQAEGDYDFAVASDDGSILDIDGKTLVNNDGQHERQWKCSNESISFKRGEAHAVRLRYYQGPRVQIALQVYMRPASKRGMSCGDSGEWTIVPAEILKH